MTKKTNVGESAGAPLNETDGKIRTIYVMPSSEDPFWTNVVTNRYNRKPEIQTHRAGTYALTDAYLNETWKLYTEGTGIQGLVGMDRILTSRDNQRWLFQTTDPAEKYLLRSAELSWRIPAFWMSEEQQREYTRKGNDRNYVPPEAWAVDLHWRQAENPDIAYCINSIPVGTKKQGLEFLQNKIAGYTETDFVTLCALERGFATVRETMAGLWQRNEIVNRRSACEEIMADAMEQPKFEIQQPLRPYDAGWCDPRRSGAILIFRFARRTGLGDGKSFKAELLWFPMSHTDVHDGTFEEVVDWAQTRIPLLTSRDGKNCDSDGREIPVNDADTPTENDRTDAEKFNPEGYLWVNLKNSDAEILATHYFDRADLRKSLVWFQRSNSINMQKFGKAIEICAGADGVNWMHNHETDPNLHVLAGFRGSKDNSSSFVNPAEQEALINFIQKVLG